MFGLVAVAALCLQKQHMYDTYQNVYILGETAVLRPSFITCNPTHPLLTIPKAEVISALSVAS